MNQEPLPRKQIRDEELRALYDIRIKEAHHYNTLVWAYPLAFATLIAGEYRFIDAGSGLLMLAALFNVTLWYVFLRHLQNRGRIQKALKFTENKLAELYGGNFMPDFPKEDSVFFPRATTVMFWTLSAITVLFLGRAVITYLDNGTYSKSGPVISITVNCDKMWKPCWLPSENQMARP